MRPRGPWMIWLAASHRGRIQIPLHYRLVYRDFNRDVSYYAPRWIAWLYKVIPMAVGFTFADLNNPIPEGAYIMWRFHIEAPVWGVYYRREVGLLFWWPGRIIGGL